MTKRNAKGQRDAVIGLLVICFVVIAIEKQPALFVIFFVICVAVIGLVVWFKFLKHRNAINNIRNKYVDGARVQRVLENRPWEGQTSEQLVDSLGNPSSIDRKVLKTKKREVWKYDRRGVNRYGLRVTLDDDIVVGWDEKS